jgi:F420-0:gamma-glutamyl ligase
MKTHAAVPCQDAMVRRDDDLAELAHEALGKRQLEVGKNGFWHWASKVVADAQEWVVKLSGIKPSERRGNCRKNIHWSPHLPSELALLEAGEVYCGLKRCPDV